MAGEQRTPDFDSYNNLTGLQLISHFLGQYPKVASGIIVSILAMGTFGAHKISQGNSEPQTRPADEAVEPVVKDEGAKLVGSPAIERTVDPIDPIATLLLSTKSKEEFDAVAKDLTAEQLRKAIPSIQNKVDGFSDYELGALHERLLSLYRTANTLEQIGQGNFESMTNTSFSGKPDNPGYLLLLAQTSDQAIARFSSSHDETTDPKEKALIDSFRLVLESMRGAVDPSGYLDVLRTRERIFDFLDPFPSTSITSVQNAVTPTQALGVGK